MDEQHCYVEKTSDTGADILLAIGFARLLDQILFRLGRVRKGLTVHDAGTCYEIVLPEPLTAEDLQRIPQISLVQYLVTEKEAKKRPGLDGFDYEKQQEISAIYSARLRELRGKPDRQQMMENVVPPHPLLRHYEAINQMKIASTFNDLLARWQDLGKLQNEHIHILLSLFSSPHNDLEVAMAACQKLMKEHQLKGKLTMTALQIVNPTTGKGANRAKSNNLTSGDQIENFWLLEFLKFVGFIVAANPYVVQGSKDRKTYVLLPKTLELSTLDHLRRRFRQLSQPSTVVKMDILASLRLVLAYVQLRLEALRGQADEDDEFVFDKPLSSMVQGFEVGFYKDMGSAYATMNVSTINLPDWIQSISTLERAQEIEALLQEHIQIILFIRNSKREEGSEEYTLLRVYRDFLSGRTLRPFWQFTTAYAGYLMSQREHEKNPRLHLRQLSVKGLDYLLMHSTAEQRQLSTITRDEGFRRIAYAIRQSTVRAQRRRSQEQDRTYEVRYGLAQELMREVRYREKFIAALSNFLTLYNAETAREEEKLANKLGRKLTLEDRRTYGLRGSISISDLDRIVDLIDKFDSETVGSLLIAYGYATEARRAQDETEGAGNLDDTGEGGPSEETEEDEE
jgi:hypothetical protein